MQKIGVGYEDYKRIIDDGCYYIDKTFIINDIIEKGGMVTLFTRPRRFGKTLALSTIKTFFEKEYDTDGRTVIDNSRYFEGRRIMEADDSILSMMGQYPVINLSLKSAKQADFRTAFLKLRDEIVWEFRRHSYLSESSELTDDEKADLRGFMSPVSELEIDSKEKLQEEVGRYATAFRNLSAFLKKHHNRNVIILLDEYDVPLENAYYSGFYDEMIAFIRSLFESALKTNAALQFAVVTGCLRISKESVFTGMNNLEINSVRDVSFNEGFGFTEEEVEKMLADYGIRDRMPEARQWYDGYAFGDKEIYNPWSIIKYVKGVVLEKRQFPEPYWANTSSNQIIKDMVENANETMKSELDTLISGGTIEKKIHEDITYADIHESDDNLWNFLFFTGYMKKVSERFEGVDIYVTMAIPNIEIKSIYINQISNWFEKEVRKNDNTDLYAAVIKGDTEKMGEIITSLLKKSISTFDSQEGFYHGFLLSLLMGIKDYDAKSNREEGDGRPDITLYPENPPESAIIFEVKVRKRFNEMQDGLEEAYKQIRDRHYEEGVLADGYAGVVSYGICFCKKSCVVGRLS